MVEVAEKLEIERVNNLIQGFGWEKVSEEYTDTHIVLIIKKPRMAKEVEPGAGPG